MAEENDAQKLRKCCVKGCADLEVPGTWICAYHLRWEADMRKARAVYDPDSEITERDQRHQ